eukprot:m.478106 g.478106  ORF g.478106 m.478106 type:complete len:299 (-) comp21035_c0_seq1:188-1084(-)
MAMLAAAVRRAAAPARAPAAGVAAVRGMATLKEISTRLKSVTSIQKITKSMKMVSTAKFSRAQEALMAVRATGPASSALIEKSALAEAEAPEKQLYIAISSDRGLCGAIHSGIAKAVKASLAESNAPIKLAVVGDRSRSILQRTNAQDLVVSASDAGKKPPTFSDAAIVAQEVLSNPTEWDRATIYYNHFKSMVSYEVTTKPVYNGEALDGKEELSLFDELDADTLKSYSEFTLAQSLYYAMLESSAAEFSARMNSMENASNNAGDMISALQLTFNRTRQAVITRELIEIISGAAALD